MDHATGTLQSIDSDLEKKYTTDTTSTHEITSPSDVEKIDASSRIGSDENGVKSQKVKPVRHKHRMQYCIKFLGLPLCIIFTIFFASYLMLFGWPKSGDEETAIVSYEIQQIVPGRIVSLSQNGEFAAVVNNFDFIQVYRKLVNIDENGSRWEPVGQTITSIGSLYFAANGTVIAYMDAKSQRPEVRQFDEEKDLWTLMKSPIIVGDELSMDVTATILTVGMWNRVLASQSETVMDVLVTYKWDGDDWIESSNRIMLENIDSFQLSPTASDMVVFARRRNDTRQSKSTFVCLYHLSEALEGGGKHMWEEIDSQVALDAGILSISLATTTFALASADMVQVYDYDGKMWGQPLVPNSDTISFLSAALNLEGATMTLAAMDRATADSTGLINFFTFPDSLDPEDEWEEKLDSPSFEAELIVQKGPQQYEYDLIPPNFGSQIVMDESSSLILVQSGGQGAENVYFFANV